MPSHTKRSFKWPLISGALVLAAKLQPRLLMTFNGVKASQPISKEDLRDALGYEKAEGDYRRLETLVSRFRLKVRSDLNDELPL
jgi:hypothetical protein